MGELERMLADRRAAQYEEQRQQRATENKAARDTEERDRKRQETWSRALQLGREAVGLLTAKGIPQESIWVSETISPDAVPAALRTNERWQDNPRKRSEYGKGWRICSHYVHLSDLSGGPTSLYGLATDGQSFPYSRDDGNLYPGLPLAGSTANPAISGIIDPYFRDKPSLDPKEMLDLVSSRYFLNGLLARLDGKSPPSL